MPCEDYLRQHNRRLMHSTRSLLITRVLPLGLAVASWGVPGGPVHAQSIQHLTITQPGGMPGLPVMTGVSRVTNGLSVTWDGPSGYYQLFQKHSLKDASWQALGTASLLRQATITPLSSNGFFRVSGPSPVYAGSTACAECHQGTVNTVIHTAHTGAYTNAQFVTLGGQTNGACLVCHTLGYGVPTGFTNNPVRPQLAGVQCENCHGPAANHASNPADPTAVPRVEVAGTMCGGCHNSSVPPGVTTQHPPYYEEWNASPHQPVLDELKADFVSTPSLISTCGRCHSGTVREAFLESYTVLPGAQDAGAVGIACATCHDPHEQFVYSGVLTNSLTGLVITNGPVRYTNQLRNPLASLQDYHTTGNWATNYNPDINVCAQCHNDRGASYNDISRPPHHSVQYNIMLGTAGVLNPGNPDAPHFSPGTHALGVTNQCVGCHMQTAPAPGPSQAAMAGHGFEVDTYGVCVGCHGSFAGTNLINFAKDITYTNGLYTVPKVQSLLVQWATNKAPAILGTAAYGTNAWAYSNYTPPDPLAGGPGPTAALQALIPTNILIARFNLYLVQNDGSFGTHNIFYVVNLLSNATFCAQTELGR